MFQNQGEGLQLVGGHTLALKGSIAGMAMGLGFGAFGGSEIPTGGSHVVLRHTRSLVVEHSRGSLGQPRSRPKSKNWNASAWSSGRPRRLKYRTLDVTPRTWPARQFPEEVVSCGA